MKNITFSIIFILLSLSSYSQDLSGTYTDGENQITFNNGSVEFYLLTGGAFIMEVKAKGIYYFIDDFLIIETKKNNKNKPTSITTSNSLKDSSFLFTIDSYTAQQMLFAIVAFLDSSGNTIIESSTDINGKCYLPQNNAISTIYLSFAGYSSLNTEYQLNTDYSFVMTQKEQLDDSRIVIKLNSKTKTSINFTVLSWDFVYKNSLSKELIMLYKEFKNSEKIQYLSSKFKLQKAN